MKHTQIGEKIVTQEHAFDFREKGREGERERNIDGREKHLSVASYMTPAP